MFADLLSQFFQEHASADFKNLPHMTFFPRYPTLRGYAAELRRRLERLYLPPKLDIFLREIEKQGQPITESEFDLVLLSFEHLHRVQRVPSDLLYDMIDGKSLKRIPKWVVLEVALEILSMPLSRRPMLTKKPHKIHFVSEPIPFDCPDKGEGPVTVLINLDHEGALVQLSSHRHEHFKPDELLACGPAPVMCRTVGSAL